VSPSRIARSAAAMMRGSVSRLGSPLESPMIRRPAARAARTRSVISTVADGFSPTTRSASVRVMTRLFRIEVSIARRRAKARAEKD
jgi:hypothetical protein